MVGQVSVRMSGVQSHGRVVQGSVMPAPSEAASCQGRLFMEDLALLK